ncbi:flagellar filament capping protein FliD [Citromicrobium bathyomarinum]
METTRPASASSIATRLGVGSGTDMVALAEDLARAQFEPRQQRLESRSEVLERQISLASTLRNMLSGFASALGDRVRTGDLSAQPSIANSAIARVSAPVGTAGKGTYSLEVTQLAKSQTLAGPAFSAATDTVGAGQLTIRFGATDNAAFTADASKDAVTIDIAAGATLADVAKAINAKGSGVTAYVSQTTSGAQLVLKGPEGANNGFVIEANEDAANPGLANLAWAPGDDPARLLATSGDAAYKLDGLERTSPGNKIENAAPGLSLDLTGTNPGNPTTIGFGDPKAAVISAMTDIVGALNEIAGELNSATDPLTGDLARDYGARALRREFSSLGSKVIMPNAAEGTPRTLAELGLGIQRDGTFKLDSARLEQALAKDPEAVAAMFTPGINGIFATIDRIARNNAMSSDPGSLAGSVSRYTALSQDLSEDLTELAEKQEALRSSMVARFSASEARITSSQSTLDFLKSQIEVWNSQRN